MLSTVPSLEFRIAPSVLESNDPKELKDAIESLVSYFKEKTPAVFPSFLQQPYQAEGLLRTAAKLRRLAHCRGFRDHLGSYLEGRDSAFFVSCLGCFLIDAGLEIHLEPPTRKRRRADIKATSTEGSVVFECKSPESRIAEYTAEHRKMFHILESYITTGHSITVKYRHKLTTDQVHLLGSSITERLQHVNKDGTFLSSEGVEVSLDTTLDPIPANLRLQVSLTGPDSEDGLITPGTLIGQNGKKLSFFGPEADPSDTLKRLLHKAGPQAPTNSGFVLAIAGNTLLGSPRKQRLALQEEFQPRKNRRFSGILIVDFSTSLEGDEIVTTRYFPNPFAKYVIPSHIRQVFAAHAPKYDRG